MNRLAITTLLVLGAAVTASAQSAPLTAVEGVVRHDPFRIVGTGWFVTLRASDVAPGLRAILSKPEMDGQEVSLRMNGRRVVALEARARGDVPLLSSPGLAADRRGEVKAHAPVLVTGSKTVDGRLWLRARTSDGKVGAVSADHLEPALDTGVGSWLGNQLAPLFAAGTRKRRARFFHPDGHVFAAKVTSYAPVPYREVADALAGNAIVRVGGGARRLRADGTEEDGIDALSLAIRFTDANNPLDTQVRPGDQDLLMSAWAERFRHFVTRTPFGDHHDFLNNHYFPAIPYEINGRPVWLRIVPSTGFRRDVPAQGAAGRMLGAVVGRGIAKREGRNRIDILRKAMKLGDARFRLEVQRGGIGEPKHWTRLAEIRLTHELKDLDQNELKYHPTLQGAGLRPTGFITSVRKAVYRASQDTRERLGATQHLQRSGSKP